MFVTRLPVISVVLWLEPGGIAPTSPYQVRVGNRLITDWHFTGIKLYELPAETLLDSGLPGLLPLVPFTSGGADLGIIERTAELVQQRASASEAETLESLLFVFAARTFEASILLAMMRRLHMSTEIIEKSAFYQEALAKGIARGIEQGKVEGIEQGIEQGKVEGIEQGKAEGLRDALLVILRARFGEPTPDVTQALASARVDTLQDVLEHALSETPDQLRVRIGL